MTGASSTAAAADPLDNDEAAPTFRYEQAAEQNYLRALLELETVFGVGLLYYVTTTGRHDWDLNYRWSTFEPKLTLQGFGIDSNHFGTNFIGHPLGGAGYYVAARSNRLSVFESYAFAFAGSLLWEYFGEITERVSMNDMIVTPVAGVAIGESTFQLGAFFDRAAPTTTHRILGSVFAPFKALNDAFDGVSVKRSETRYPENEWHRFELGAGLVARRSDSDAVLSRSHETAGLGFRLVERLARLPSLAAASRGRGWFIDANVSSIELEGALEDGGLFDLRVGSRAVLAGYGFRDVRVDSARARSGFVGVGTAFEYSLHDYGIAGAAVDRLSSVLPLSVFLGLDSSAGGLEVRSHVDVGPSFAGVTPHAMSAELGRPEAFPEVMQKHHYYFGLGGLARTELELRFRSFALDAGLRGEMYDVVNDETSTGGVRLHDLRVVVRSAAAIAPPRSRARFQLEARHELRSGARGSLTTSTQEDSFRAFLGAVF